MSLAIAPRRLRIWSLGSPAKTIRGVRRNRGLRQGLRPLHNAAGRFWESNEIRPIEVRRLQQGSMLEKTNVAVTASHAHHQHFGVGGDGRGKILLQKEGGLQRSASVTAPRIRTGAGPAWDIGRFSLSICLERRVGVAATPKPSSRLMRSERAKTTGSSSSKPREASSQPADPQNQQRGNQPHAGGVMIEGHYVASIDIESEDHDRGIGAGGAELRSCSTSLRR